MRIDELQIDDWVFDINNDIECQVGIKDFRNGGEYILDYYKSIPLTAEILEKNGFEDVGQDIYQCEVKPYYIWWESDRYRLGIDKDESDYEKECFGEVMRLPIIYVHELQHALRLLQIEKEIEL